MDLAPWIDADTRLVAADRWLTKPLADLALTRDCLVHLRRTMGEAARKLEPFEEACAGADGSRFEQNAE